MELTKFKLPIQSHFIFCTLLQIILNSFTIILQGNFTYVYSCLGVTASQAKWIESLRKVARFAKEENGRLIVKLAEIGVLSFGARIPGILAMVGFQQSTLDILVTFSSGLTEVYNNLLHPPPTLTGNAYEIVARILLGFQAVVIFGAKAITPSIKQAVVYSPFYIDKALADGKEIGLPIILENFSDGTIETVNKRPKEGNFCFSGGRDGPVDTIEYQKFVLTQLFHNEVYHIWDQGNQVKNKRLKKSGTNDKSQSPDVKKRRIMVNFTYFEMYIYG